MDIDIKYFTINIVENQLRSVLKITKQIIYLTSQGTLIFARFIELKTLIAMNLK